MTLLHAIRTIPGQALQALSTCTERNHLYKFLHPYYPNILKTVNVRRESIFVVQVLIEWKIALTEFMKYCSTSLYWLCKCRNIYWLWDPGHIGQPGNLDQSGSLCSSQPWSDWAALVRAAELETDLPSDPLYKEFGACIHHPIICGVLQQQSDSLVLEELVVICRLQQSTLG